MKAKIKNIQGKETKSINMPTCFSAPIREDLVAKAIQTKIQMQPYAPSLVAGKQHAASGKIVHRRHVWRSGYGRGMSRIPRKVMSRRGSQFNFVAAEVSSTRGGRRAHPPKVISMKNTKKMNKRELDIAMRSALSSTVDPMYVQKRYETLKNQKITTLPLIVESKITTLKVKDLLISLKKILGDILFSLAIRKRKVRAGKGTRRGRKYKKSQGVLLVIGKEEKLKTKVLDIVQVKDLGVKKLSEGGLGRLTLYTENAIKELGEKYK